MDGDSNIIEQAPDPPLTLEHIMTAARRNGHVVYSGNGGFETSVEHPAGCHRCGATCSWIDEEETQLLGRFVEIWNKRCTGPS
jgi:hypothetical protein